MSRKVQEDLSGLSAGERWSKRFSNFGKWLYNSEDGSIMGERQAKDWGMLLLYYIIFYAVLSGFTAIFFGLLGFMLPVRPQSMLRGICSPDPNAKDACGRGPFFQILDLAETSGQDSKSTNAIFQFGVCEPALVAIPRAMALGNTTPENLYSFEETRKGYGLFTSEVNRVLCQGDFDNSLYNPSCGNKVDEVIFPLVPVSESSATYRPWDQFASLGNVISDTEYTSPQPLYSFGEYEVYIVFFHFNKIWNYQPYNQAETTVNSSDADFTEIENHIGITCEIEDPCKETGASAFAKNYRNNNIICDKTVSKDKRVNIELLSDVMTNFDGFPWRGGALNMNFGSLALTYKKGEAFKEEIKIKCEMGVSVENGRSGVKSDGTATPASAVAISNMEKPGPSNLYTSSTGKVVIIPVTNKNFD